MPGQQGSCLRQLRELGLGQQALQRDAAEVDRRARAGKGIVGVDVGGEQQPVAVVAAEQDEIARMVVDADREKLGWARLGQAEQRALFDEENEAVAGIGAGAGEPCRVAAVARYAVVDGA